MGLAIIEPILQGLGFLEAHLRFFDLLLEFALYFALLDIELGGEDAFESRPLFLHELLIVAVHEEEFLLGYICREWRPLWRLGSLIRVNLLALISSNLQIFGHSGRWRLDPQLAHSWYLGNLTMVLDRSLLRQPARAG